MKKILSATVIGGDVEGSSIQMPQNGSFSLYFHVPFCSKKCPYCHFYVIPNQERYQALYMEALHREWEQKLSLFPPKEQLASLYFGGGTPALLTVERLQKILSWASPNKTVEVTLEVNPEQLPPSLAGINRVSLGVQSFDNPLLHILGRTHLAKTAENAIYKIKKLGVDNISIDLMYDLPNQTLETWERSLDKALSLPITHISLYNLTIEAHTSFYKNRHTLKLPDQSVSLNMLEMAVEKCQRAGFERYEISAFAKPGFRSQHNIGYWTERPFLGLGPSAFSYWEQARFQNRPHLHKWAKKIKENLNPAHFYEKLTPLLQLKEKLAIRLRFLDEMASWPSELASLQNRLIEENFLDSSGLKLSNKGILFHDTVAEIIINS